MEQPTDKLTVYSHNIYPVTSDDGLLFFPFEHMISKRTQFYFKYLF